MGSSNTDVYLDWTHPGGSIRPYMFDSYSPLMAAYNFAPPDAEIAGPLWDELWQERLENNVPWGIGYITHPLQGPYWRERSLQPDYGRIEVPVLFWCGWADPLPYPDPAGFLRAGGPQEDPAGSLGPLLARRRVARSPDRLPARDAEVVRPLAEGGGNRGDGGAGGLPFRAPLQGAGGAHVPSRTPGSGERKRSGRRRETKRPPSTFTPVEISAAKSRSARVPAASTSTTRRSASPPESTGAAASCLGPCRSTSGSTRPCR